MYVIRSAAQKFIRLARRAPRGRWRLSRLASRIASTADVTLSAYGPLLETRNGDATFRLCAEGSYGFFLSDLLDEQDQPFSFLDIGANIGLYSLIAARSVNCRHCYAFEPQEDVFRSLQSNIALNHHGAKVTARNLAISDTHGEVSFSVSPGHSGGGLITGNGADVIRATDFRIFDDIAASDFSPKFVKIDVEGHEPVVVDQLIRSKVWSQIDTLICEASDERFDVGRLVRRLETHGLRRAARNGSENAKVYDLMFVRQEA